MLKKEVISVNAVLRLITIMLMVMILCVYAITGVFIYIIDQNVSESLHSKIVLAFHVERTHDMETVNEYSYWDETYFNTYKHRDEDWIQHNLTDYLLQKYEYDFAAVKGDDGKIQFVTKNSLSSLAPESIERLSLPNLKQISSKGLSGYQKINQELYEIILFPFISEVTKKRRDAAFIVGMKIDDSILEQLALSYDLPTLWFASNDEMKTEHTVNLRGFDQTTQAVLRWNYESKAQNLLPYMISVGLLLLAFLIIVVRKILQSELNIRIKYEKNLYEAATQDFLTGVLNRGAFLSFAENEAESLRSECRSFSLVMLDIDYFKNINDVYGHAIGDLTLVHFAKTCEEALAERDILGRLGGEEFGIFLPDAGNAEALEVATRIQAKLKANPFTDDQIAEPIVINVSIGIATHQLENISISTLYQRADEALYKAKETGRDRVVIAEDLNETSDHDDYS